MMNHCLFCEINNGNIPCYKIYEDRETLVFLDVAEDVDGHMLAVPKKHCAGILDCDADTLHALKNTVKKVSEHIVNHCGYDGVNLLHAAGSSAGQSVGHFHIHIIPRKSGDGINAWPTMEHHQNTLEEMQKLLEMRR